MASKTFIHVFPNTKQQQSVAMTYTNTRIDFVAKPKILNHIFVLLRQMKNKNKNTRPLDPKKRAGKFSLVNLVEPQNRKKSEQPKHDYQPYYDDECSQQQIDNIGV